MKILDKYDRPLRDLRISVTDRCNFRCKYCMPKDVFTSDYPYLQRNQILSLEEIARVCSIMGNLGVEKYRLTGGEPLIRKNIEFLIESIASLPFSKDISLTTNGSLLTPSKANDLHYAGLNRVTISLDAIDDKSFKAINDVDYSVDNVLKAIDNAIDKGLGPVKVNMVVMKGINEDQILPMANYFSQRPVILRFIEFMDVGNSNRWNNNKVIESKDILSVLKSHFNISPISPNYPGEVAKRWKIKQKTSHVLSEIGLISSISQPFCSDCNRIRLSAQGKFYTCLFSQNGHDIKEFLRDERFTDDIVESRIKQLWNVRRDRYSEERGQKARVIPKIEMSYIGG